MNFIINDSNVFPFNLPCATAIRASGIKFWRRLDISSIFWILLFTKKTCPPLSISYLIDWEIIFASNLITDVSIGYLFGGGVVIKDKSLAAIKLNWSVLGIGVAERVNTSTFFRIDFSLSLTATPNFCSSSIINKPKSLYLILSLTSWCVPIIISILPSFSFSIIVDFSLLVLNLLR